MNDLVLAQGIHDTRTTLAQWNRRPWSVLGGWLGLSVGISAALLVAVYSIAN